MNPYAGTVYRSWRATRARWAGQLRRLVTAPVRPLRRAPRRRPTQQGATLITKVKAGGALLAALLVGMLAATAVSTAAAATPPTPTITASHEVSCGKVEIKIVNATKWPFSADLRLDDEPGVDDEVTGMTIAGGPHKGKPFGQRYTKVELPAGETVTHTVTVPEDSGEHHVAYRVWRGPENDLYLDWTVVEGVESDCEPEPTASASPEPTVEPTATASPEPQDTTDPAPSTSPAASGAAGGQLPTTGAPIWGAVVLGVALVAGGAVMLARRRTRFVA
jgi:LPXTG-motif cell wall-anchored protein